MKHVTIIRKIKSLLKHCKLHIDNSFLNGKFISLNY